MTVGVVSEGSTLVCETPMEFARVIPCPVHYLFNAMGNLVQSVVEVIILYVYKFTPAVCPAGGNCVSRLYLGILL